MSWQIRRLWKVSIFLIQEPLKKPKYVKFTLPPPKVEVSILSYIYIGLLYIKVKILTSGFQRLAQSVGKIEKSKKKSQKGPKKSQNYNFLPKNEKVSTSVSHWSSLWYIKSKILPWRICRLWKDSAFLFRSQKKPKYVKFGLLIFHFFLKKGT